MAKEDINVQQIKALNNKMAYVLQSIINGCEKPDRAITAVLVPLAPIREVLKEYRATKFSNTIDEYEPQNESQKLDDKDFIFEKI